MIDIHAHLLPGADDGAADYGDAQAMLVTATGDGISHVVVTPHVHSALCRYRDLEQLAELREEFKRRIKDMPVRPQVLFGAEVHLTAELPDLLASYRELLTINNSSYVLVEFPQEFVFPNSSLLLGRLLQEGFIPIVAHPERNEAIQSNIGLMQEFAAMGVLGQVNAGSLTGRFGDEPRVTALRLLRLNAVQIVASDAHDNDDRQPLLSAARRVLTRLGPERLDALFHGAPLAVIKNEPVPEPLAGSAEEGGIWGRVKGWFS